MNNIKQIAIRYLSQVKEDGVPVTGAYLFGSYTSGLVNKFSDIDVCIVSPIFGSDYFGDSLKLKKSANKIDLRIEPVPFSQTDLNNKYSTLASEIVKYGVSLM